MEIGIGLPSTIRGVDPRMILRWAERAEERGFSSIAVLDRVAYGNIEPFVTLSAAAAVTERVRLVTTVLLAPLRTNHTLFAKQAASLDRLAGGRLVLGLGVGARADDYEVGDVDFHRRGALLDALIERAKAVWRGELDDVGPEPATPGGPRLVFGGQTPAAFRRAARHGSGWVASGRMVELFGEGVGAVRAAWAAEGRADSPQLLAIGYFALGTLGPVGAESYLGDYYAFAGPGATQVVASALTDADGVAGRIAALEAAGCEELILHPCIADLAQVDLLADAAGL